MEKIIIENRSNLTMLECLDCVKVVIEHGRISNKNKQYAYMTVFRENELVRVSASLNKKSDKFIIW